MGSNLVDQGMAALKAGDKRQAVQLLAQGVKEDRDNEKGWYYLAQLQRDPAKKEQCLKHVLRINPNNSRAQAQLDELTVADDDPFGNDDPFADDDPFAESASRPRQEASTTDKDDDPFGDDDDPFAEPTPSPRRAAPTPSDDDDPFAESTARLRRQAAASGGSGGVSIGPLSAIPGAPEKVAPAALGKQIVDGVRDGGMLLAGQKQLEAIQATWWSLVVKVVAVSFIIGLLFSLQEILFALLNDGIDIGITYMLTVPFMTLVSGVVAVGAGGYLSYWYLQSEDNSGSLLDHFSATVNLWIVPSLIMGFLAILEAIDWGVESSSLNLSATIGSVLTLRDVLFYGLTEIPGIAWVFTLIAAAVTAFTAFKMQGAYAKIHNVSGAKPWVAALIALVVIGLIFHDATLLVRLGQKFGSFLEAQFSGLGF